jgi:hypothetical protein
MLTTGNIPFKSEELAALRQTFVTSKTPRGDATKESMNFCLKSMIVLFDEFFRLTREILSEWHIL